MRPYSFTVSLRIFHPFCDPSRFTDEFAIAPFKAWKEGERRPTSKGTLLDGTFRKLGDVVDWLAQLVTHIPNRGEQMVRLELTYDNDYSQIPHIDYWLQ